MKKTLLLLALVALLLCGASLGAQQFELQPYRPQEDIAQSPDAARVFSLFARAWSSEDAGQIAGLISEDGRVALTIESRGVSSQVSRGQMQALLSSLFSEVDRGTFELSAAHHAEESTAYAVGDWIYQARDPGRRQRDKVFVVLREAGPGTWVLSELRIQSAR